MDETMIRCLKRIDGNFGTLDANQKDIWKAIRKNAKKIRGVKGVLVGFGVGILVLAAELAERKRCEKYLEHKISDLETDLETAFDRIEEASSPKVNDDISDKDHADGGVCDA